MHMKDVGGVGNAKIPQLQDQSFVVPMDWSPDGRSLMYEWQGLWILPVADGAQPYQLIKNVHKDSGARFSPDGKWVAFASNETGRDEIYVSKLDQPGEKRRISADGGSNPIWSHSGRELFYVAPDSNLMSVEITPGADLSSGRPTPLFKVDPLMTSYDVRADGQAFLCVVSAPGTQLFPYAVAMDWTAEIKK
jgi:dipeptidyl aminopeptidase/acylaminoacyl peptidase